MRLADSTAQIELLTSELGGQNVARERLNQQLAQQQARRIDEHAADQQRPDGLPGRGEQREARGDEPGQGRGQDAGGAAVVALPHVRLRLRNRHVHGM